MSADERFSRQIPLIGEEAQEKLRNTKVCIVGVGALGSCAAELLARAGVGNIRVIDRDIVEVSNLQRQHLFTTEDIGEPKATAIAEHLKKIYPEVNVEPKVNDLNPDTAEDLLGGVDIILDGTDNLETRFLINDFSVKTGVPWIYSGAIRREGVVMPIFPGEGPCLRCLFPKVPGHTESCWVAGVTPMITTIVSALQTALVFEYVVKSHMDHGFLISIDSHGFNIRKVLVRKNSECLVCAKHEFEYLEGRAFRYSELLCGQDTVQILAPKNSPNINFNSIEKKLKPRLQLKKSGILMAIKFEGYEITLFRNGRALIKGKGIKVEKARSIYNTLIGM